MYGGLLLNIFSNEINWVKELLIFPFFTVIVTVYIIYFSRRYDKNTRTRFLLFYSVNYVFNILFFILYYVYYGDYSLEGDTGNYFNYTAVILNSLEEGPFKFLSLAINIDGEITPSNYMYVRRIQWFNSPEEYMVLRITAFTSLFTGHSYLSTSLFFKIFAFLGIWKIYEAFTWRYPSLKIKLYYGLYLMPSFILWSSGIMKDPLCIGALGYLFYVIESIKTKNEYPDAWTLILSFILVSILIIVKFYVFVSFMPCIILYILFDRYKKHFTRQTRYALFPMLAITFIFILYGLYILASFSGATDIDSLAKNIKIQYDYLYRISIMKGGSAYYLGEQDGTFLSLIKLLPSAFIVAFFRPFIWEVNNILLLFTALESLLVTIFFIRIFIKNHISSISSVFSDNFIRFILSYVILYNLLMTLATANYGSLIRYKVQTAPFLVLILIVLSNSNHIIYTLKQKKLKMFLRKLSHKKRLAKKNKAST